MAGEVQLTIVGNLTADPELRYTNNGLAVANFTIASQERTFDRQKGEMVDGAVLFLRCSVWREHAEQVAGSLSKGMRVIAQGKLRQRNYTDKDNNQRTSMELEIDEIGPSLRFATAQVTRVGGNRNQADRSQQYRNQQNGGQQGGQPRADEPWNQPQHQGGQQQQQQGGSQGPDVWSDQGGYDDETPF